MTGLSFDVLRAMTTKASPADGGYILRGTKIWSTTAHVADRIMVTARTCEDPKRGPALRVPEAACLRSAAVTQAPRMTRAAAQA